MQRIPYALPIKIGHDKKNETLLPFSGPSERVRSERRHFTSCTFAQSEVKKLENCLPTKTLCCSPGHVPLFAMWTSINYTGCTRISGYFKAQIRSEIFPVFLSYVSILILEQKGGKVIQLSILTLHVTLQVTISIVQQYRAKY